MEALKTGTVQKITVHNPSNGIVADLIESAAGKVGIMMNSNIGAKDLTEIVKSDPSILNGMIAHSQGTIKFTQVLKELNKTEEGRKLIKETPVSGLFKNMNLVLCKIFFPSVVFPKYFIAFNRVSEF